MHEHRKSIKQVKMCLPKFILKALKCAFKFQTKFRVYFFDLDIYFAVQINKVSFDRMWSSRVKFK